MKIEKKKVARSFLKGIQTYDQQAIAQQAVDKRLIELLHQMNRKRFGRVLEIGCCTGMLTEMFCREFEADTFYINDLVPEFYDSVVQRLGGAASPVIEPWFGDIEERSLPLELDMVLSSSTFQWLSDFPALLTRFSGALGEQGVVAFSMFGEDTLYEVTRLTDTGLPYLSFQEVRDRLSRHFSLMHAEVVRKQLYFSSPTEILKHIQATGVSGVGGFSWTPRRYEKFSRDYHDLFGTEQGLPVTYVSYLFIGTKKR